MGNQNKTVFLALLIALLALLALIIVVWRCCDEDVETAEHQIILEDTHSASWMAIDNGFVYENPGTPWNKWNGILFQVGTYYAYAKNDEGEWIRQPEIGFNSIIIEGTAGIPVELKAGDFTWLNIVGEHKDNTVAPITRPYADLLFPNDRVDYACKVVDDCASATGPSATACTDPLSKALYPCVRRRSLHGNFDPFGIVTYWHGDRGYRLTANENSHRHDAFTFDLLDDIRTVEVWNGTTLNAAKQEAIDKLGSITRIRFKEPSDLDHGELHDPPIGFGKNFP